MLLLISQNHDQQEVQFLFSQAFLQNLQHPLLNSSYQIQKDQHYKQLCGLSFFHNLFDRVQRLKSINLQLVLLSYASCKPIPEIHEAELPPVPQLHRLGSNECAIHSHHLGNLVQYSALELSLTTSKNYAQS